MAIIANGLKTNATVTNAHFCGDFDDPFFNALAVALLSNSTLQNLFMFGLTYSGLFAIFLSLGMNTALKSLSVNICDVGDEMCAAITSGLVMNSTLEDLSLLVMTVPNDDDGALSAREYA